MMYLWGKVGTTFFQHEDCLINQGQGYSRMRRKGFSEGWVGSKEKGRHLQSDDLMMCPVGLLSFTPSCVILCRCLLCEVLVSTSVNGRLH